MARARGARRLSVSRHVRVRTVALPIEHGAWGFWLEPALLGLVLALTPAGVALAVAALAALLLQTPLSIALTDARRGRRYPRTALAWRWAAGYGLALIAAAGAALWWAPSLWFLLPIAVAAPLALAQLWYDAYGRSREAIPETLGALAMGSLAAAIVLAAGWPLAPAFLAWLLLAARIVPSISYVRARLRLERGTAVRLSLVRFSHLVALGLVLLVGAATAAPWWLLVAPYALLTLRALLGVSALRRPVSAPVVGVAELGYGLVTALLVALALGS